MRDRSALQGTAGRAGRARAGRGPGRVRSAAAAVRVTGGHQHGDGRLVLATSLYDDPAAGLCGDAPAGLDEQPEHGL